MAHGFDSFLEMPRDLPEGEEASHGRMRSFEAFSREHYSGLLHFLRLRVVNEEDAKDAAQESLMRLMRYRETAPDASWKPLLYRIAINVANEQFRRGSVRRVGRHVSLDDVELASGEPSQEEWIEHEQQQAWLRDANISLKVRCRQVYLLSRMQGMTDAQIANLCDISVKTVEKHMTKALAALCSRVGSGNADAL
jgi:RNA polymerase sigma-70 factor (ECF subfamily)